jgi:hypothetical protein
MPPPPAAPGVVKVTFEQTDGSRTCGFSIHISDGSGAAFTLGDMNGLATHFELWHTGHCVGFFPSSVTTAGTTTLDLTSSSGFVGFDSAPTAGTSGTKSLPLNVALVEKLPIGRRYRGGHGHVFIPFISDQFDYTGEVWHSTDITSFDGIMGALNTAVGSATSSHGLGFQLGVLSYRTGGAERGTPLFQVCEAFETQPRVCSRRKRLPKITG